VLEEQKPVFLPDLSQEMLKHPALAPFASQSVGRSTCVFPVSTSQERYGILVVTKERGEEFVPEDVELLRSLASHVAVALECALARDSAEHYQRDLAKEHDRLRLLLEINNHAVSQLEVKDVFRAASTSIRSYFANEFTGVWLIDRAANQLQSVLLDFPTGKGLLDDVAPTHVTDDDFDRLRRREPGSFADIERLPFRLPKG
jgi:K+-sensing histidine kinase KdpD